VLAGLSVVPAFWESSVVPGLFADGADPIVAGAVVVAGGEAPVVGDGFIDEPPPAPLCICCWEFAGGSVLGF
jgi:hypothetical protein